MDFSMQLYLPYYVMDCDIKQLKKVTKILIYESFSDWHTIERQLMDMINAAEYAGRISQKKADKTKAQKKLEFLKQELTKVRA